MLAPERLASSHASGDTTSCWQSSLSSGDNRRLRQLSISQEQAPEALPKQGPARVWLPEQAAHVVELTVTIFLLLVLRWASRQQLHLEWVIREKNGTEAEQKGKDGEVTEALLFLL
jgi:hypothetical protein